MKTVPVQVGAVSSVGPAWRSWKGGEIDAQLQSDLTIYPGLGGGALVDVSGQIHGINSGGLSRPFATTIPVQTVERVITALLNKGYVARGYIGAALHAVRFSEKARERMKLSHGGGVVVLEVDGDGPAATRVSFWVMCWSAPTARRSTARRIW